MPKPGNDNMRDGWNDRVYRSNLAKIDRIRSSDNLRLKNMIDEMETSVVGEQGEDGYRGLLGSAPLETVLKRFFARHRRRGTSQGSKTGSPSRNGAPSSHAKAIGQAEHAHPEASASEDQREYDYRNSTDVEQALIDERQTASPERRRKIDEELDAIHRDRLRRMENGLPVDEFSAEEALERHRRAREGGADRDGGGVPSNGHNDGFNPRMARSQTASPSSAGGSASVVASPPSPQAAVGADGRVSASRKPTSEADAPVLVTPELPSAGEPSQSEDDSRGFLDEGRQDGRGALDDASDLGGDANDAKEAAEEQKKRSTRRILRMLLPALMHLMPILIVILSLLMLAQCVAELNPFGGSGGSGGTGGLAGTASSSVAGTASSTNLATRKSANPGIPSVYVDPNLADLFSEDEEDSDEKAVTDYPYVATFFGSDDDWTDTLYASDDCVNFRAIGTVPNKMRDPCIMLRNGRYWVVTCLNDEDGHVWLEVSSSRDLKEWTGPTKNGPFDLDRLPRCNGYGTSSNYDVVAPEWFLDEDNSVHVIFSCGHWGACHGHNWDDWMESYMLDVDKLEMSDNENRLTAKGPVRWMDVNSNYADRIDGTIDFVNGVYYLTIKRNGLNMELWKNSSCSPYGWVRLKDCFLYGYEAPCVFEDHEGTWHIFGDGCPDVRPFGTKMWTSGSIDGNWTQQTIHFFREDGSEVPLVRHGTVLPVEGATGGNGATSGGSQSDGTLDSKQKAVIEACKRTASPGAGLCALWVGNVYENANVGVSFRGHAYQWYYECCQAGSPHNGGTVKTDPSHSKLKPGMVIAVPSSSSGTDAGRTYGHVGIYIGGGKVMHNIGTIDTCTVDQWISTYGKYASVGWGYPAGMK